MVNDTLNLWREEGRRTIPQNFTKFHTFVEKARDLVQHSNYEAAAVYAKMAALYAIDHHCGIFASAELERILLKIGQAIPSRIKAHEKTSQPETLKKILHISTRVMSISGHSRMIWRWVEQDTQHSHSVVLTQQGSEEIPKSLRDAVSNSHGEIHVLNQRTGNFISWIKWLREIAAAADLVVLHVFGDDVIPIIAFADREQFPPIIFLDHGDHVFWLGTSISDVVVNLRESGMRLSQERRGIEAERNMLLPIILPPTQRVLSRLEAKQQLGLPEGSIVLLSIARGMKYKSIGKSSYADAHIPLLEQHERAILVAVGPSNTEDWSEAIQKTQGRIIVHAERADTAVFYQAADIYVDSFPFISTTSLLEAGSYGLPLVSRFPFTDASAILSADIPGLTGNLIRARNLEEYTAVLSRLVEDEEFRLSLGEATRKQIAQTHIGDYWQRSLNDIYTRAATVAKVAATNDSSAIKQVFLGEPDILLQRIYGWDLRKLAKSELKLELFFLLRCTQHMPLYQRLSIWTQMLKKYGLTNLSYSWGVRLLLPKSFYLHLKNTLTNFGF